MFEHLGYFKEYFIGLQSIGTVNCEKDRETLGYIGRKKEILTEDVLLSNNRKIKKGIEVTTILYPLCGRMIKTKNN